MSLSAEYLRKFSRRMRRLQHHRRTRTPLPLRHIREAEMNTTNRIIDTIDTLVDDQLAEGPHDDYNVNRYDKCGHCGRDWHGLRITTRIEHMRIRGVPTRSVRP